MFWKLEVLHYQDLPLQASEQLTAIHSIVLWGSDIKCRAVGDIPEYFVANANLDLCQCKCEWLY